MLQSKKLYSLVCVILLNSFFFANAHCNLFRNPREFCALFFLNSNVVINRGSKDLYLRTHFYTIPFHGRNNYTFKYCTYLSFVPYLIASVVP